MSCALRKVVHPTQAVQVLDVPVPKALHVVFDVVVVPVPVEPVRLVLPLSVASLPARCVKFIEIIFLQRFRFKEPHPKALESPATFHLTAQI